MRLNLPKHHCVRFDLFSDFIVPTEYDADIGSFMDQTHTHDRAEGDQPEFRTALFGSKSKIGGITHRLRGRLTKTRRQTDLNIALSLSSSRSSEDLRPPPRSFRPVSQLVDASSTLFGPILITCHAVFEYDQKQGHKSKILFPIPLLVPDEAGGITHIESAQFSRRDDDETKYQVIVDNREDSDVFVHSVTFDSNLQLSQASIRNLIDKAQSISTGLLIPTKGA